jgi:hypothetical protein
VLFAVNIAPQAGFAFHSEIAEALGVAAENVASIFAQLTPSTVRQVPSFLLHHQLHQGKTGLTQQVVDPFSQKSHELGHGKDHLNVGILLAGQLAKLLYRSLLVDLVSSLHSDSSPYLLAEKTTLGPL